MKKRLGLFLVLMLFCLTVLPVAAFAGGPAVSGSLTSSHDGSTVTFNIRAVDEYGQPAANGPLAAKMTVGIEVGTNWQTHKIDMTLVSSDPSTGSYTYTATRPSGYTVGVLEVWFSTMHIGMNVWYTP